MNYRHALIRRWSRRDRFAVLLVALTVAFLTGSTLLIVAASAQPIGLADQFSSSGTATVLDANDTPEDELTLPIATATRADGVNVTVIGVPATATESWDVPPPPDDGFSHGTDSASSVQFNGESGSVDAAVQSRTDRTLLPPQWYVTTPETVAELGTTETLVLTDSQAEVPATGVPLQSVLGFFLAGQSQLLAVMGAVVSGGAVLVAVTVYSVTRMSVRDRLETIRTARATGATPRTILGTFAVRAAVLTATGVTLGYALGVILPNIALSVAVFFGFPTALNLGATSQALVVLLPTYVGLVLIGAFAGIFAAWSTVRGPPSQLSATTEGQRPSGLILLDWRTLVPTTATLSVFMSVLFVVSALTLTAAPVATTGGSTISEPGTAHPIASQVPTEYADALQTDGIDASAEVVGFAVVDGQPFLTRGADYESFAAVTDATLESGRMHNSSGEAVIGASLAQTLDVEVGETLTLGGSDTNGVTRITIVGTYTAPGAYEDQLLLSLPAAQHLAGLSTDTVNVIRTDETLEGSETTSSVSVLNASTPERAVANDTVPVNVTLRNHDSNERSHTVTATLGDERVENQITLAGGEQRTVQLSLPTGDPGSKTIRVNDETTQSITIVDPETPRLSGVPAEAPPGSEPLITVQTATGEPLANTPVTIDDQTVETGSDGQVRLPVGSDGTREVRVTTEQATATATINVTADAERELVTSVNIVPASPTTLTTPTARTTLYNPWNEQLERTVSINGPGTTEEVQVQLAPGERVEQRTTLSRQPAGTYEVRVEVADTVSTQTSYEVSGDDRTAAALASSGYTSSGGSLDQAIEAAVGNITLLLVALGGLAASMTVGGLSASMARAVHARRRTIGIHRAVGASPRRILRMVLRDALAIGALGTVSAFIISLLIVRLLSILGFLTVYGIRIPPLPTRSVAVLALITGVGLTLCSAAVAVGSLLYQQPTALLTGTNRATTGGEPYD
ncbi:FtsX-like permease family protein [Halalkalicoccus paucihalophilus]|uniref:FtsX-like permease family protein n=1 Tax=Halalkalicoccus paucihalophilus TaxID=1008153 RepID=A0A151ABI8_9EURY|nr:FtsX-like permease family protein [Halalkalicoccus paucihalophilus]KYH24954.1 FtsX-like permease family protein [Halalkalicoccus paucihalophilus]